MNTFKIYRQYDAMVCGPTCLRMVARHHRRSYALGTKLVKHKIIFEESFLDNFKKFKRKSGAFASNRLELTATLDSLGIGWLLEFNRY